MMSPAPPPGPDSLPPELARRIDSVCNRFERAWQSGGRPRIEDFLDGWQGPERDALLRELVLLELFHRRRRGEACSPDEYRARFPGLDAPRPAEATVTADGPSVADPAATVSYAATPDETTQAVPPAGQGCRFGAYELLEEIARGGMGVVHRARDVALDREVAVKLLLERYAPRSPTAARFVEEARITGQLQHPGIPAVYQIGALADGRPFLAMKLIKGRTLDALIRDRAPFDPLAVVEAVGQAVGYAHAHGVIHRDLKPGNVMVGAFGEVQVMDWGLAKVLTSPAQEPPTDPAATATPTEVKSRRDAGTPSTQAGSVLGTPAYMAPEQAAGALDQVDTRSDVFGLGAILCALLTGKPPFGGGDVEAVLLNAVRGRTEEAFARLDGCGADPGVIALCKRCLAFERADRPGTADEVAAAVAALRRAADERARQAERDRLAAEVRAAEQAKRRRAVQWAAGAVVAVLVLGVAGTAAGLLRADAARRDAETAREQAEGKRAEAQAAWGAEADQRQKAETAKAQALAKEAEATAVVTFFKDKVFAAARPKWRDGGLGQDVTLRDAITASLPALATGFADQPLVEARLRVTLGDTFHYLGEHAKPAEQYERGRAIYTERRGPDDPDTLWSLHKLANSYSHLNRRAEALKLREEVLAARRRVLGPDHPETLWSMHSLAESYTALRRPDAPALHEQVVAARRRVLGPDHPDTLLSMQNLGNSYYALRRHAEALKLREEVLAARRRVLGPDHPATLGSMHTLADSYRQARQLGDALKLNEETLAACRRVLGPDHPGTLKSMYALGNSYAALRRWADALKLQEEALAGQRRVLPTDHMDTVWSMVVLANSYAALGRRAEALKLQEEALAARRRVFGLDHTDTLWSMRSVIATLIQLNRGAEAVPLIDECVRHFQGKNDPAGCRATAATWEKLNRSDAASLYTAARYRAVAAALYAQATQPAEAAADADRAMAWLTKAVAAGYKDRAPMEKDKDLDALRDRADFQELLESLAKPPELAPPPRPVR